MGPIFRLIKFDGPAPTIEQIAAKMTEISGLAVSCRRDESDPYDAHLSFSCKPEIEIRISVDRPNAMRRMLGDIERDLDKDELAAFQQLFPLQDEQAKAQTMNLTYEAGDEQTLLLVTELAFESLGGLLDPPISEEDRLNYQQKITELELEERNWKSTWTFFATLYGAILSAPIWLPRSLWSALSKRKLNEQLTHTQQVLSLSDVPEKVSLFAYLLLLIRMIPSLLMLIAGAIVYLCCGPFFLLKRLWQHLCFKRQYRKKD